MSCVVEMESSINLDSLPPDIIRRVITMTKLLETDLRLISRSWNALGKQYYTGRKLPDSLERMHLCPEPKKKKEDVQSERVIMHAIMPEQYSMRLRASSWLKIHDRHNWGAVEVTCGDPQQITNLTLERVFMGIFAVSMLCCSLALSCISYYAMMNGVPSFAYAFIAFAIICCSIAFLSFHWIRSLAAKGRKTRARLSRFVSSFTHIETLVVDNFVEGWDNLDYIRIIMRGVKIDSLEVIVGRLDPLVQERILKLCRDSKVQRVFIKATMVYRSHIGDFVLNLSQLRVAIDIYETSGSNSRIYFNYSINSWIDLAYNLKNQGISMGITTAHNAAFTGYPFGVKSHMRFEKTDRSNPLRPVEQSRELEPPLTIASLPPDVIRTIIRLEKNSEAELRLMCTYYPINERYSDNFFTSHTLYAGHSISASWNALWKEYARKLPNPLERVHLSTGILNKSQFNRWWLREENDYRHRVIMHAILPNRHASKVGIGSWLRVFQKLSGGVEVICNPTLITNWNQFQAAAAALCAFCVFCFFLIGSLHAYLTQKPRSFANTFIALSVIGLIAAVINVSLCCELVKNMRKKRARFARFFSMFAHIETLVLDHFHESADVLDYVCKTLKGVKIYRLEIKGGILDKLGKEMQSRIIKMCGDHSIRHVFIEVTGISNHKKLGTFAGKISKLGVTLDLYETYESWDSTRFNHRSYFNHSITSINKMSNSLRKDGIYMSMRSIHDAAFLGYPSGVKSHMRFEQSDGYNLQPLQPLEISRGFIL